MRRLHMWTLHPVESVLSPQLSKGTLQQQHAGMQQYMRLLVARDSSLPAVPYHPVC
jgi:hypothetical protein